MSGKPVDADESPDLLAEVRVLRQQVNELEQRQQEIEQEQQRPQQQQAERQRMEQLRVALAAEFSEAIGADKPVDALALPLAAWAALSAGQRLAAALTGAKLARLELQLHELVAGHDPRAHEPYVVVCGRDSGGRPRIVYGGRQIPSRDDVAAIEQDGGYRAWRLAGPALGIAEEALAGPTSLQWGRVPDLAGRLPWLLPGAERQDEESGARNDFCPRVPVRVSLAAGPYPPDEAAEFEADLDTGAQFCAFPREAAAEVPSLAQVLTDAHHAAFAEHLGKVWEVFLADQDLLRLEVQTQAGWQQFWPQNTDEVHELRFSPDWGPDHALCQVRPDRQAFVGRPIWRGAVKLTLESSAADWESAPPVTY